METVPIDFPDGRLSQNFNLLKTKTEISMKINKAKDIKMNAPVVTVLAVWDRN